jgi:hypothetical protein
MQPPGKDCPVRGIYARCRATQESLLVARPVIPVGWPGGPGRQSVSGLRSSIASWRLLSFSGNSYAEGWSEPFTKVRRGCQRGELKLTSWHPLDARTGCPPLPLKRAGAPLVDMVQQHREPGGNASSSAI